MTAEHGSFLVALGDGLHQRPTKRRFVSRGLALSTALIAATIAPAAARAATPPADTGSTGAAAPPTTSQAAPPLQTGIDRPVIVIPAASDDATVRVTLRGLDGAPQAGELEVGPLVTAQQPGLQIRPQVRILAATAVPNKAGDFVVDLNISELVAFGESNAPLLYKGRQVESLRFSKPGLVLRPAGDGGWVARERSAFLVELGNPTAFEYKGVRARMRFDDQDMCLFETERFDATPSKAAGTSCDEYPSWTAFDIPRYAQVSLRVMPAQSWFFDQSTGYARSGKRKGWLTLRFQSAATGPIHEQNLPLEVQFEPGNWSLFSGLVWVAALLAMGAVLSLLLRVSIPNIKRRRELRERLREAASATASISNEVDSNLRVLLRVERLALDQIRTAVWSLGPGYGDYARRVEQGLSILTRRIDAVRRLDAALIRRNLLAEQGVAPTRLEQIEELATAVSETLKQDKLTEEDWVFVNQHLEMLQKALREPTQTEKEAFEAMLAGRWRLLRDHFGTDASGKLKVPPALVGMEACFPDDPSLLPAAGDDGSKWVQSVGPVRADLQLSALMLVYDYQFLASASTSSAWAAAKQTLTRLLATPACENLRQAKSLLRQLAEGVTEDDIVNALRQGNAMIVMDPAIPRPNQKIRFAVRFRVSTLNTAAARDLVSCSWTFQDRHAKRMRPSVRRDDDVTGTSDTVLSEDGWYVHHYFEQDVTETTVSVAFHDSKGKPVSLGDSGTGTESSWSRRTESVRSSPRSEEKWGRAWLEVVQLFAALLVPLATLAATTVRGGAVGQWWEILAIGFGSDTIKNILVGRQESETSPPAQTPQTPT